MTLSFSKLIQELAAPTRGKSAVERLFIDRVNIRLSGIVVKKKRKTRSELRGRAQSRFCEKPEPTLFIRLTGSLARFGSSSTAYCRDAYDRKLTNE